MGSIQQRRKLCRSRAGAWVGGSVRAWVVHRQGCGVGVLPRPGRRARRDVGCCQACHHVFLLLLCRCLNGMYVPTFTGQTGLHLRLVPCSLREQLCASLHPPTITKDQHTHAVKAGLRESCRSEAIRWGGPAAAAHWQHTPGGGGVRMQYSGTRDLRAAPCLLASSSSNCLCKALARRLCCARQKLASQAVDACPVGAACCFRKDAHRAWAALCQMQRQRWHMPTCVLFSACTAGSCAAHRHAGVPVRHVSGARCQP